ncbi:MAG: universal stress protein [Alphaproteobacteria bacterium]|nr:universal stress protein [Alphaproteobacteria bacterium]
MAADGSEHANRAVDLAADLALATAAEVIVLHAMRRAGTGRVPEELQELARVEHIEVTERAMLENVADEITRRTADRLRARGVAKVTTQIVHGDPAVEIVDAARRSNADLIVIGRRGLGGLGGTLLGSVSLKVNQAADAPVLTVK